MVRGKLLFFALMLVLLMTWSCVPTELEPSKIELLQPEDESEELPNALTLAWKYELDTQNTVYDVYLDTSKEPETLVASNIRDNTLLVSGLKANTTYYWKVVAKDPPIAMEVESAVHSFTTGEETEIETASTDVRLKRDESQEIRFKGVEVHIPSKSISDDGKLFINYVKSESEMAYDLKLRGADITGEVELVFDKGDLKNPEVYLLDEDTYELKEVEFTEESGKLKVVTTHFSTYIVSSHRKRKAPIKLEGFWTHPHSSSTYAVVWEKDIALHLDIPSSETTSGILKEYKEVFDDQYNNWKETLKKARRVFISIAATDRKDLRKIMSKMAEDEEEIEKTATNIYEMVKYAKGKISNLSGVIFDLEICIDTETAKYWEKYAKLIYEFSELIKDDDLYLGLCTEPYGKSSMNTYKRILKKRVGIWTRVRDVVDFVIPMLYFHPIYKEFGSVITSEEVAEELADTMKFWGKDRGRVIIGIANYGSFVSTDRKYSKQWYPSREEVGDMILVNKIYVNGTEVAHDLSESKTLYVNPGDEIEIHFPEALKYHTDDSLLYSNVRFYKPSESSDEKKEIKDGQIRMHNYYTLWKKVDFANKYGGYFGWSIVGLTEEMKNILKGSAPAKHNPYILVKFDDGKEMKMTSTKLDFSFADDTTLYIQYLDGDKVLKSQKLILHLLGASGIILFENLDSYSLGQFPPGWGVIYDGAGIEYCKVDDTHAYSPPYSLTMLGLNGWSQDIGWQIPYPPDRTKTYNYYNGLSAEEYQRTVNWLKEHPEIWVKARVMTSKYNIEKASAVIKFYKVLPRWGTSYGGVAFGKTKSDGYIISAGGNKVSYEPNKWYEVLLYSDLKERKFSVWVNGRLLTKDAPINADGYPEFLTLVSDHANAKVWFDDIEFGYGYPDIGE